MPPIHPILLKGAWRRGYALDQHVIKSVYLGPDSAGHDRFETTRSEAGELLYRLKYKGDQTVIPELVAALAQFVKTGWKIADRLQAIVPVPPSKPRARQPVLLLAQGVGAVLGLPVLSSAAKKAKTAPPIKDISDYEARRSILKEAFVIDSEVTQGRSLLVLDDLFQSGATLNTLTEALYLAGKAHAVFVLTVTKTRA